PPPAAPHTLSLHDALPISSAACRTTPPRCRRPTAGPSSPTSGPCRSARTPASPPPSRRRDGRPPRRRTSREHGRRLTRPDYLGRSEEHTSELQSLAYLVCR